MSRINLTDNTVDVITKMAEGNPGALTAMMNLIKETPKIDPDNIMGSIGTLLMLDTWGIYGTDIYVLWSDICGRDTAKTISVIRACQLGIFNPTILKDATHRQDYSGKKLIPVEELYKQVKERLPLFDINEASPMPINSDTDAGKQKPLNKEP
jgi:hypothetical protein